MRKPQVTAGLLQVGVAAKTVAKPSGCNGQESNVKG